MAEIPEIPPPVLDITRFRLAKDFMPNLTPPMVQERLQDFLNAQIASHYQTFRKKWEAKLLSEGATSFPASMEDFVEQIVLRPDYLDASGNPGE